MNKLLPEHITRDLQTHHKVRAATDARYHCKCRRHFLKGNCHPVNIHTTQTRPCAQCYNDE